MLATLPAHALVRWNEGRDKGYVEAGVTVAMDSNIYTSSIAASDLIYTANIGVEYQRHAGLIGINATADVQISEFTDNPSEEFSNPQMRLEFNKDTGRTTGSIGLSAVRSTRADPTVNVRTDSWNYGADFDFKYPVSDQHALSGSFNWRKQDYSDNTLFVDIQSTSR
ncbi:MAG: hypothetical protein J6386_15400 [Candidatus Synoicihabitans palmerolidicus]|nr:hypothetical protein [Candidatus Synoicihabitans palmerolidicus]